MVEGQNCSGSPEKITTSHLCSCGVGPGEEERAGKWFRRVTAWCVNVYPASASEGHWVVAAVKQLLMNANIDMMALFLERVMENRNQSMEEVPRLCYRIACIWFKLCTSIPAAQSP